VRVVCHLSCWHWEWEMFTFWWVTCHVPANSKCLRRDKHGSAIFSTRLTGQSSVKDQLTGCNAKRFNLHLINLQRLVNWWINCAWCNWTFMSNEGGKCIYIAPLLQYLTLKVLRYRSQFYRQITPYLALPRKFSPDGTSWDWGCGHLIAAYYLFIYPPRKDERLSWPGWLPCSGWFTHISGHPSAASRTQDRESLPVEDRLSTTVPRNQPE